ncbi:hypothetical protein Mp_6g05950 [Marchantia polymorpha subsp. ruderalis]|uniref:Uncharacterized protein n=2 Tax=Marchantia polymorpha TaxID=3197 RepID=A0AAF6BP06_MARPO|nr:hypothetical protein MARPO_0097s0049 [Marchantia polymorpha]BBN13740.1 hypothetical protein Mp_6g05950 [Marchantia polymorpha subsp. ruderalis]|eukprot:PTQ32573.1 hypothetical protein MARPO_0097s0049 [Marchantia polymorpha]
MMIHPAIVSSGVGSRRMEACTLSSLLGGIRISGSRLSSTVASRRQTVASFTDNFASHCRTSPKLWHKTVFSSSSVGHLGACARSVLGAANVTKDTMAKTAMHTLEWISSNQRLDGAWGCSSDTFFDLITSTLACLVSLKTWNSAPKCSLEGEQFLKGAFTSMKTDDLTLVSPGMFHALAELLEEASRLDISLPYSCSVVEHLRIHHGQLLHSLKGTHDLIKTCSTRLLSFPECIQHVIPWNHISELQSADGDLFSSPAATACLYMKTRDNKALCYLNGLLDQFGSAVPSSYPKRVSHILSLIDHLERLNIDRHFHREIHNVLETLSREWTPKIDEDTQDMVSEIIIFRALREHGYLVLPETSVFARCCKASAAREKLGARCMLELYRASELKFPGEEILDYAKDISTTHLTTLLSQTSESDSRNVMEEIKYVLDFPYFMRNLPQESMIYMDRFQYKDETMETYVETGFSRTTHARGPRLLAFAKSNFSSCQSLYQKELESLARWVKESRFAEFSFVRQPLYPSYLTAVGVASGPEMALARASWTMSSIMTTAVDDLFDEIADVHELRLFVECVRRWDLSLVENCSEPLKVIARGVLSSVNFLCEEVSKIQGRDLSHLFQRLWVDLVMSMLTEAEWTASGHQPSSDEYIDTSWVSFALGPIVPVTTFFLGSVISDEDLEDQEYWDLFRSVSTFGRLLNDCSTQQRDNEGGHVSSITAHMREHPELTADQARIAIQGQVRERAHEVLSKLLNPSYTLPPVRSGWLGMMRALYMMYYRNVDGFSNTPAELKKIIKRFFFQPIESEQA